MFNPPSPRRSSAFSPTPGYPPVHPQSLQSPTLPNVQSQTPPPPPQPQPPTQTPQLPSRPKREAPNQGLLQRVIPPDEDMRRLLQECRFAHGNAQLLSEALAFASPEDLRDKDIIKAGTRSIFGENVANYVLFPGVAREVPYFPRIDRCPDSMGNRGSRSLACRPRSSTTAATAAAYNQAP